MLAASIHDASVDEVKKGPLGHHADLRFDTPEGLPGGGPPHKEKLGRLAPPKVYTCA
jgi:hypothetical protein